MNSKTFLPLVMALALSACDYGVTHPANDEALAAYHDDTPETWSTPYTRPVKEIFQCLERHYWQGDNLSNYEISDIGNNGKFIAAIGITPAVYEFNDGVAVLKLPYTQGVSIGQSWYVGHKKRKDFVINQSRDKCIS
jgi:hypothetical protein